MIELSVITQEKINLFTRSIFEYAKADQLTPQTSPSSIKLLLIGTSCYRLYKALEPSSFNQQLLAFSHGAYSEARDCLQPEDYGYAKASVGLGLVGLEIAKITGEKRTAQKAVDLLNKAVNLPLVQSLSRLKVVDYDPYRVEAEQILAEIKTNPVTQLDEKSPEALFPEKFEPDRFIAWYNQQFPSK